MLIIYNVIVLVDHNADSSESANDEESDHAGLSDINDSDDLQQASEDDDGM